MRISEQHVITHTLNWVKDFIVAYHVCPFAKREVDRQALRLAVSDSQTVEQALLALMDEVHLLDKQAEVATTLLVYPEQFLHFFDYLDFLSLAEQLLNDSGYEGIYQLASFHPDYYFDGTDFNDVANYTNRSPYPMLHLLREDHLEKAIAFYGDTTPIPQQNIEKMRQIGINKLQDLLTSCRNKHENEEK